MPDTILLLLNYGLPKILDTIRILAAISYLQKTNFHENYLFHSIFIIPPPPQKKKKKNNKLDFTGNKYSHNYFFFIWASGSFLLP